MSSTLSIEAPVITRSRKKPFLLQQLSYATPLGARGWISGVEQLSTMRLVVSVTCNSCSVRAHRSAAYFLLRSLFSRSSPRRLAHRAWAARRSASLRSSGPTFRHRAAPRPTACRFIGEGESFRLAMSSISSARSSRTSGGRPALSHDAPQRHAFVARPDSVASSDGIVRAFRGVDFGC